ncbi:hypothetical protein ATO13_23356 [Stappia sp. 22II-S9-Z10]|nr:hypothetical protein ATO13_23356 [Stappia sp. 22II-S9-Z10]
MIEMKFTGESMDDIATQIADAAQSLGGMSDRAETNAGDDAQTADKPKRKRRTKAEMEAARTAEAAEAEPTDDTSDDGDTADAPTEPEAPAVPTVDDLKAAGKKLVEAGAPEAVKSTLAALGVAKLSDVPEDKRADVLAAFAKAWEDAAALA